MDELSEELELSDDELLDIVGDDLDDFDELTELLELSDDELELSEELDDEIELDDI